MKKVHRFITDFTSDNGVLKITAKDVVHQISKVLKLRPGEQVVVGKGDGLDVLAKVARTDKEAVYLEPQRSIRNGNEPVRRIVLYWEEDNVSNALFSEKYVPPKQEFSLWLAVVAILAGSTLFIYFHFHERRKEDMLFGFRHDEKIAINYIQEKKIALQRDLEEQFKFSRAKATRIVSKLVEKGLVRKQRYGRTNKLTWLK